MEYVVYYRVSTRQQGDSGLGLEAQQAIVEHYLKDDTIVKEFTEVISGKEKDRPKLLEAIALCKKKGYTLAVAKLDRFSRKTEHALYYFEQLEQRLFSCDVPTNLDKFTLTLFMAISDREGELISIRTKAALAAKKARGEALGNPQYMNDKGRAKAWEASRQKAKLNHNNKRATALICEYKGKGMTLQAIADRLNEMEFKTSKGMQFQKTTVSRIYKRYCEGQAITEQTKKALKESLSK